MNAIAKSTARAGRRRDVSASDSPALTLALYDAAENANRQYPASCDHVSLATRREAGTALASLEPLLVPASPDDWMRFLKPLAALPKAPDGQQAFAAAVSVIAFALSEIPASILTPDRLREAMRRFKWWPTPCEVLELLQDDHRALVRRRNHLRTIVELPPPPPPKPPLTAAEKEKIAATLAGLRKDPADSVRRQQHSGATGVGSAPARTVRGPATASETERHAGEQQRPDQVQREAALLALAARVDGLFLSHHDPERFHVEKHAVAAELRRLARAPGAPR